MLPNYYELLDINEHATDAEIKQAYRAQIKQHHPDLAAPNDSEDRQRRNTLTARLNEAHDTLSHPAKRSRYDYMRLTYILKAASYPAPPAGNGSTSSPNDGRFPFMGGYGIDLNPIVVGIVALILITFGLLGTDKSFAAVLSTQQLGDILQNSIGITAGSILLAPILIYRILTVRAVPLRHRILALLAGAGSALVTTILLMGVASIFPYPADPSLKADSIKIIGILLGALPLTIELAVIYWLLRRYIIWTWQVHFG